MNSYPVRSPGYHHVLIAAGVPDAVSMNRISGVEAGSNRSAAIVKNMPYGFVPSAFNTCTTLLLEFGSASRKRYRPAGSVTPGNVMGPLKVKRVRLSRGCADTGAAKRQANTATAQTKPKMRVLSMIGPPCLCDGAFALQKQLWWDCGDAVGPVECAVMGTGSEGRRRVPVSRLRSCPQP